MTTEVYPIRQSFMSLAYLASKTLKQVLMLIYGVKVRYCFEPQTPMTKEVYRVLCHKASLLLLVSNP